MACSSTPRIRRCALGSSTVAVAVAVAWAARPRRGSTPLRAAPGSSRIERARCVQSCRRARSSSRRTRMWRRRRARRANVPGVARRGRVHPPCSFRACRAGRRSQTTAPREPQCSSKTCGPDGCGGSCGTCSTGTCNSFFFCGGATCGATTCGSHAACCQCSGQPICFAFQPGGKCSDVGAGCK